MTVSEPDPNSETSLTTSYTYDADGNVLSVTDPNGYQTTVSIRHAGPAVQTTDAGPGQWRQHAADHGPVTQYVYDNLGELLSTTDPMEPDDDLPVQRARRADPGDRSQPRRRRRPAPRPPRPTMRLGGVLTTSDALGDTTTNTYDGFHNLYTVTNPDGGSDTTTTLMMPTGTCSARPTRTATPRAIRTTLSTSRPA